MTKFGATRCGGFSGWILTTLRPCREVISMRCLESMSLSSSALYICQFRTKHDKDWILLCDYEYLWIPVACCTTHDRAGDQEPSNVFTMWGFSLERNGVPEKKPVSGEHGPGCWCWKWLKIRPKRQTNFAGIGSLLHGKAVRQENHGKSQFNGLNAQFAKRCPWANGPENTQVLLKSLRRSYNRWPKHDRWVHLYTSWVGPYPKGSFPTWQWQQAFPKTIVYWKSAGYVSVQSTSREVAVATWFRTHQTNWKCVWCSEVQTETGQ